MKIKNLVMFAIVGLTMTACSSNDDFSQDTSPKPIVIKAGINGMDSKTRATGDATALQNTAFLDGEKINVYLQEETNYPSCPNIAGVPETPGFIVYQKKSGIWEPSTETQPTEPLLMPRFNFLFTNGFYPSKDAEDKYITKETTEFTVAQDQTLDENYRKSDLMFSSNSTWNREEDVCLNFSHMLTKITIEVDLTGVMTEQDFKGNVTYFGVHANKTAKLGERFVVTSTSNLGWLRAWSGAAGTYNSNSVSCIIPPQTIDEGADFIDIDLGDAYYYYKAPVGGLTLEAGKEYTFTISLQDKNLVLGQPEIDDWIPGTAITGTAN